MANVLEKPHNEHGFNTVRNPRSDAYKAGVKCALLTRFTGETIGQPHALGTPEADAFYAGIDEDHRIFRDYK